ncbi:MAG TPA: DUF4112 domain-containing protein [Acidobacteriota bacterium]|nr:DUF4112 domain-containing protein [Acidobacteriota bacterium]
MDKTKDLDRVKNQLDQIAWFLDNAFKVPGVNWRFGAEAIIGLIPGAGDIISGTIGLMLLFRAFQFKLPKIVILRMIVNTLLDITVGAIPFLGDIFDFIFKSNSRNMALFREYAEQPAQSTTRHWIFIGAVVGSFGLILLGILFLFIYLINLLFFQQPS